jgi:hypothetical protein
MVRAKSLVPVFTRLIARERVAGRLRKLGCTVEHMESMTNAAHALPHVISVDGLAHSVERLTDAELLAGTRRLVGRSNSYSPSCSRIWAKSKRVESIAFAPARASTRIASMSFAFPKMKLFAALPLRGSPGVFRRCSTR